VKFPLREGVISEDDVVGEIGQVVDEKLEGRASESDMTIFDSTGFALQDSTTVPLEHEVRWPPGSASRRR
jgi:alanine dehydrogenase